MGARYARPPGHYSFGPLKLIMIPSFQFEHHISLNYESTDDESEKTPAFFCDIAGKIQLYMGKTLSG